MLGLSILALSCRRTHLLRRTLPPLRNHFQSTEPNLDVQWICFDNGSIETRAELLDLGFDFLLLSKINLGQGPAFNQMMATVRTPYFMFLEDDWELMNPRNVRFVEESMKFMSAHKDVGTVKLDTCHFLEFGNSQIYSGPYCSDNGLRFYVQNPNMLWGGMGFTPAITRTDIAIKMGMCIEDQPFRHGWAESYCSYQFSRIARVAKSPDMLLFNHICDTPSVGWKDQELKSDRR